MVATYTGSYLHCLLVLSWPIYTTAIDWNGNWAFACDFFNNNIGSVQISGEECGVTCEQTPGCTHFTWNPYDGGICWLKGGSVTKDDAYYSDAPGIVCGVVENGNDGNGVINWNGNWAFACDFFNNNIGTVQISGEQCGSTCEQTPGCTHFTWNPYDGGICWLKGGPVTKDDAYFSDVPSIVCGVVEGSNNGGGNDGGGNDGGCGSWALDGLNTHNMLRAKHRSSPLVLKKEICDWAQNWANQLASDGTMHHRPDNKYGENLFMTWSSEVSASEAVQMWYNELSQYTYGSDFSMETGHFTQVIWKSTSELGMAKASANGMTFVVANYNPPGNYEGQFIENVLPPI